MPCLFCDIAEGKLPAEIVWRGEHALAFLDHKPLFAGHLLLIPKRHIQTMSELSAAELPPVFTAAQTLERAVVAAMKSEGSFVAINNRVSQSVPHLHIHIVPRRKGDGLRGFFWPRSKYTGEEHLRETADAIRKQLE